MITKICGSCNTEKPLDGFYKQGEFVKKRYKFGYDHRCKSCNLERHRLSRINNPIPWRARDKKCREKYKDRNAISLAIYRVKYADRIKGGYLKRQYGISVEEYNRMFQYQNGCCAICLTLETRKNNKKIIALSVDHCHKTGKVRGLLCSKCNHALGLISDNEDIAMRIIKYLKFHKEELCLGI